MSRTFKGNPFELTAEQKAGRVAIARDERLARHERQELEGTEDDGRILNLIMDGVERATGEGGPLDQMAEGAFGDPDGELGGLAAGVGHRLRGGPQR